MNLSHKKWAALPTLSRYIPFLAVVLVNILSWLKVLPALFKVVGSSILLIVTKLNSASLLDFQLVGDGSYSNACFTIRRNTPTFPKITVSTLIASSYQYLGGFFMCAARKCKEWFDHKSEPIASVLT